MSGSSLDGLDIALCEFSDEDKKYNFKVIESETIEYNSEWYKNLSQAFYYNSEDLYTLDLAYGRYLGDCIKKFISNKNLKPDLIASHGHTIFHRPMDGITVQIGNGKMIQSICEIPCIANFRLQDVRLGGQGAPLVPIGDRLLFSEFHYCLNLGGFSNISCENEGFRIAFDLTPCNILLNALANKKNLNFDEDGKLARSGNLIQELLGEWNELEYYKMKYPKSLAREWYEANFHKSIHSEVYSTEDLLHTAIEHISFQISDWINSHSKNSPSKVLITGGGAHNIYFIERLKSRLNNTIKLVIPSSEIINYKEALIFAFLGYLRMHGKNNVLRSVTGAEMDHSTGDLYF